VSGHGTRKRLSYKLMQHTTLFQAGVYAIKAYAVEHVDKGYEHRDIYKVLDKL
jgi:hypothetical protein